MDQHDRMRDPAIQQDQTIDDRLTQESSTSTIPLRDAILRALAENNGSPATVEQIVERFQKSGSDRALDVDIVRAELGGATGEGLVQPIDKFFRLTEAGRSRLGPMAEINLGSV